MKKFKYLLGLLFIQGAAFGQGADCSNPIIVASLPFSAPGSSTCGMLDDYSTSLCNNNYMGGDDIVYTYTPAGNEVVDINLSNLTETYSAIHLLDDCPDIATTCVAYNNNSGSTDYGVSGVSLTGGITYFIVISTWPAPQCITSFDLDIVQITCSDPTNLNVSNLTANSVDLGWTENGTATNWIVENGAPGFTPTSTTVTTTNPESITGLTAATDYEFYVRTVCAPGDTSAWSGPFAYTTLCGVLVAPWLDDIEAHSTTTSLTNSECWSAPSTSAYDWNIDGSGSTPSTGTGPLGANSGVNYFYTEATSGSNGDLAELQSPVVDITALTNPALSFYYHMFGDQRGIMSDLYIDVYDGTTWTVVDSLIGEQQITQAAPWLKRTVNLAAYSGNIQVRFRAYKNGAQYGDVCLDDIAIEEGPSCFQPVGLTANNIGAFSADLGWTEIGGATNWIVEVGTPGFTPSATTVTLNNPESVMGLSDNTDYEFYVRTVCGAGDTSLWSVPFAFTTECAPFIAPYLEEFDATSIPACWTEAGPSAWEFFTPAGGASGGTDHSGNGGNAPYMDGNDNTNGEVSSMTSPLIDISGLTNAQLRYYVYYNNTTDAALNKLIVELYDGAAWVQVDSIQENLGAGWVERNTYIGLSGMTITGNVQVRFTVTGDNSMGGSTWNNDIVIDDVELFDGPTCPGVSAFTLDYVTTDSIVVSWTENGSATLWDVEYGPTGFALGAGTANSVTSALDTLSGLATETTYDIYVRSDCGGGDLSGWVGPFTVTTNCSPITAFPYLEDFESGASDWSIMGLNTSWAIGTPTGPVITAAANGTGAAVTNLTGDYLTNEDGFLITPCFDFTTLTNPVISFNQIRDLESCCDESWVDYSIDGGSTWIRLGTSTSWYSNDYNDAGNSWWDNDNFSWTETAHALPMLAGAGLVKFRIGISSDGSVQDDGIGIDDFSIIDETCPRITDLVFNSAITDTLAFGWTSTGTETMWNVEYGPTGFTPGTGTVYTSMNNPDTLFQLADGEIFDIYVSSDCGGGDLGVQQGPLTVATPLLNDFTCDAIFVPADGSVAYFSNIGASQQAGEAYQGNGHSVWFKTVVPTSGHLAIGTCGNDANTQMSTFGYDVDCTDSLWMNNITNTSFNPWACDLNSPAGSELCGLTPGDTIYFSISTFGADAIFPIRAWDLQYEAGTGSAPTVCIGDIIDLNTQVTGSMYEYTGYFDYLTNPTVIVDDTTAATANFTVGNDSILFIVENTCMSDTAFVVVDGVSAPNTGTALDPFDGCNTGDVYLMGGLTGTVDAGGTWSDDDATGLLVGNIFVAATQPTGTYDFTYTVDNGVCPTESSQVTVTLNNCVGVEETAATFGLYPNPNNGTFSISSNITEVATIQVLDAQGKVVYNKQINLTAGVPSDVQVANVSAGIYMVRLQTANAVSVQNIMVK